MFNNILLSLFPILFFSLTNAQFCPPPLFLQKMEQLSSNTPNCFCVASLLVPAQVSPSADLIHLSFLVGEGPLVNLYRPAQIRCARQRSFSPSRQQGRCCFSEGGRQNCVPVSQSQRCLVSMLSLSSEVCPPNPVQGAFSGRGGFQLGNGGFQPGNGGFQPGNGGFQPGNGGFQPGSGGFQPGNGGFGGFGFQSPSVTPEPDDRR